MITAIEKIQVTCPQCGKRLTVPAESLGKKARCPGCSSLFPLQASTEAPLAQAPRAPAKVEPYRAPTAGDYASQPIPPLQQNLPTTPITSAPVANPFSSAPPAAATTSSGKYNHGFGWEHRGWDAGVLGGLAMMGIAVLWFVLGLACGIIFYYPPVLFVLGLVGVIRGLVTGNVTGR